MARGRLWARIRKVWITVGLSATVVFVVWSLVAYRADSEARTAIRSDTAVEVRHEGSIWRFVPAGGAGAANVALIFFPGALVDPRAYAPLLHATAQAGFASYIVELPRRGAFGGAEDPAVWTRLRSLLAEPGTPRRWIVGGHSRGAVVASQAAANALAGFAGLVLIGTSHPRDVDLSALTVPVTKIVGTRDGLATPAEVEQNRRLLPAATRWVWVEGGNHSQFGWYGFQPGDRFSRIAAAEQRRLMREGVLDALRTASTSADAGPPPQQ